MDTDTAKILASVTGIEITLKELKDVSVKRLNDHADRVRSLELTRARQRGAGALVTVLGSMVMIYVKFWKSP